MSEEIIKVLNYIGEQLGIAIDWSSENVWPQVLDILGRYRILQIIDYTFSIIICICATIILWITWTKVIQSYKFCNKEHDKNFWWYYSSHWNEIKMNCPTEVLIYCTIFGFIAILYALYFNMHDLLNWIIVPEIKYLELLKGYIG